MSERRSRNAGRRRRGHGKSSSNNDDFINDNSSSSSRLRPASTVSQRAKSASVSFSVVEIREFERVVGDNPSCSSGVPVSIGWAHGKTFTMNVEDFEKARPPRRAQMDLVLTRGERHRLLVEWGASGQDVIEAIRMIIRVKNQRRQTVNNLGSYDRVEEFFERIVRSAKKVVFRSSSNTAARKLHEECERAASTTKRKSRGQVPSSHTANDTVTTSTAPKRSLSSDARRQPPCKEVSVHKDFDSCSHSEDVGDGALEHEDTAVKAPEECPSKKSSSRTSTLSADQDTPPSSSAGGTDKDGSDAFDADDMSNPQSHEHHKVMEDALTIPADKVKGRTVDI